MNAIDDATIAMKTADQFSPSDTVFVQIFRPDKRDSLDFKAAGMF